MVGGDFFVVLQLFFNFMHSWMNLKWFLHRFALNNYTDLNRVVEHFDMHLFAFRVEQLHRARFAY